MKLRTRFWIEAGLSTASVVFGGLTLLWRDWVEIIFGADQDHGDGSFEWAIVGICVLSAFAFSVIARREFRRSRPATA
jgi:hypothetical protein